MECLNRPERAGVVDRRGHTTPASVIGESALPGGHGHVDMHDQRTDGDRAQPTAKAATAPIAVSIGGCRDVALCPTFNNSSITGSHTVVSGRSTACPNASMASVAQRGAKHHHEPPMRNIVGRVISVTQAEDVAVVLLGFDNIDDLAHSWVDVHSLLRIDGVWKIMNKTATHSSRGAWAGAR